MLPNNISFCDLLTKTQLQVVDAHERQNLSHDESYDLLLSHVAWLELFLSDAGIRDDWNEFQNEKRVLIAKEMEDDEAKLENFERKVQNLARELGISPLAKGLEDL